MCLLFTVSLVTRMQTLRGQDFHFCVFTDKQQYLKSSIVPDISKVLSRYLLNEQIRKPCCFYLQKIITNLPAGTMFSLPNRSDKTAVETPQISKHPVSTSGSHLHFSDTPGALRQSFHLLSGYRVQVSFPLERNLGLRRTVISLPPENPSFPRCCSPNCV